MVKPISLTADFIVQTSKGQEILEWNFSSPKGRESSSQTSTYYKINLQIWWRSKDPMTKKNRPLKNFITTKPALPKICKGNADRDEEGHQHQTLKGKCISNWESSYTNWGENKRPRTRNTKQLQNSVNISIITLSVNDLNSMIKSRLDWKAKLQPCVVCNRQA